ncbi:unnamed protein product [Dovyalis caffra]|uniref:Uncharacterized protein n=1 Tax=Dovyalis caffra TaxID=77055 RepID=A0AAV1SXG1_9ROSI|nr:unnamed protein product [Dovyalis caffra]
MAGCAIKSIYCMGSDQSCRHVMLCYSANVSKSLISWTKTALSVFIKKQTLTWGYEEQESFMKAGCGTCKIRTGEDM